MWRYIVRRLLLLIPIVLGVAILVFCIMDACPGDAVDVLASNATEAVKEELRESMGLNDPFLVRMGRYLKQTFIDLDLGESYMSGVSVTTELAQRFPNTLILSISGILISLVVGIPLGIYAATHQNKPGDYVSMAIALLGVSVPGFWLSLMMVVLFAHNLGWLPPYGETETIRGWILPILSSCLSGIGMLARQMRSGTLEVINSDYIVMARAKGLSERKVLFRHALPNALIPVITVCGTSFGMSLGGGMLVETIFSIPGIGYYMIKAVNNRDYPVVQSSVLVLAIMFSVIMLLTDLVMAAVDPRIKAQFAGKKKDKKKEEKVHG